MGVRTSWELKVELAARLRKRHCVVFLGVPDPRQACPNSWEAMKTTTLHTFFKVARVTTLLINGVHPYHSSERKYLPLWTQYRNKIGMPCLGPCWLRLVVSQLRTPIL